MPEREHRQSMLFSATLNKLSQRVAAAYLNDAGLHRGDARAADRRHDLPGALPGRQPRSSSTSCSACSSGGRPRTPSSSPT
ncbi:MAG: hypothetical protein M0C28_46425 [Candidatus Moduliflexus flocculans]|nr:hypothetical protein [Candidatus Moduliflexus flocculans]